MSYRISLILFLISIFLQYPDISSGKTQLDTWRQFAKSKKSKNLIKWLKCQARSKLTNQKCPQSFNLKSIPFYGGEGIFVTFTKNRKVRGCFGAFNHRFADLEKLLLSYLEGALFHDPRYEPLALEEIDDSQVILTIAEKPFRVASLDYIDTARYGLMIIYENQKSIVIVPGEIRGIDSIKRMINKFEDIQLFAFRAITIKMF